MNDFVIIPANKNKDAKAIKGLLQKSELPSEDILNHLENFFVARSENKIIGTIGLEICGNKGLLR